MPEYKMEEDRLYRAAVEPLLAWYAASARTLPWRENRDPYRVWVSEIMLQQTRVEAVRAYYLRFMETFPDVFALAAASEDALLKAWAIRRRIPPQPRRAAGAARNRPVHGRGDLLDLF